MLATEIRNYSNKVQLLQEKISRQDARIHQIERGYEAYWGGWNMHEIRLRDIEDAIRERLDERRREIERDDRAVAARFLNIAGGGGGSGDTGGQTRRSSHKKRNRRKRRN